MSIRLSRYKFIWLMIILIGLLAGGVTAWRLQTSLSMVEGVEGQEQNAAFDCEWNPLGSGSVSWVSPGELEGLKNTDLIIKAKVVGHRTLADTFRIPPTDPRVGRDTHLINDLHVLDVLKGEPVSEVIPASSGGICLSTGDTYFLFLNEPSDTPVKTDEFTDDPVEMERPPVYIIRHPFSQYRVRDGKIEVFERFRERQFPGRLHGLSEEAFIRELQLAIPGLSNIPDLPQR